MLVVSYDNELASKLTKAKLQESYHCFINIMSVKGIVLVF